jgi:glycosyltransferase involved in cell wall biosynthesis
MNIGMAFFEFGREKGTAHAAAELSLCLAEEGHDVHFHCIRYPKQSPHPRIHFKRVAAINSFSSFGIASFAFSGGRSLKRFSYDITHSHGNIVGSDVITAHSCHKAALSVARSYAQFEQDGNWGIADALRLFLERKNYAERRFKKVIAVSSGVKRELMEFYGLRESEVCIIPNGVDTERFHPALKRTSGLALRERLGIRPDEIVLIVVAHEYGRKGLAHCIDALSLLKNFPTRLLVVGNDRPEAYRAQARQRSVADRVVFCGMVSEIETYYAASDIFLLPTYYEAFSLATLEAAASGLPLLVTKVNGTEEFIREGVNGFFIQRDAEDIACHLARLVEDNQLRESLGAQARRSAETYSWEEIAHQTLRVYEEVR